MTNDNETTTTLMLPELLADAFTSLEADITGILIAAGSLTDDLATTPEEWSEIANEVVAMVGLTTAVLVIANGGNPHFLDAVRRAAQEFADTYPDTPDPANDEAEEARG